MICGEVFENWKAFVPRRTALSREAGRLHADDLLKHICRIYLNSFVHLKCTIYLHCDKIVPTIGRYSHCTNCNSCLLGLYG